MSGSPSRRPRSPSTRDESSLPDHHLGGLDDRHHGVARLEPEALDRSLRDQRRHFLTPDVDHDLAHDSSGRDGLDRALELIARADFHTYLPWVRITVHLRGFNVDRIAGLR